MRGEVFPQRFVVLGAAGRAADRVQLECKPFDPQRVKNCLGQRDHLRICGVGARPRHLDAKLMELPQPARLRLLVAEAADKIARLERERIVEQAVLQDRAHRARRPFGAQGNRPSSLVLEGIHLLLYHIGGIPHRPAEQLGMLEDREPDFPEPVETRNVQRHLFDILPFVALRRQDILCPTRRICDDCHLSKSSLWTEKSKSQKFYSIFFKKSRFPKAGPLAARRTVSQAKRFGEQPLNAALGAEVERYALS